MTDVAVLAHRRVSLVVHDRSHAVIEYRDGREGARLNRQQVFRSRSCGPGLFKSIIEPRYVGL
jgi:hypothetical protein